MAFFRSKLFSTAIAKPLSLYATHGISPATTFPLTHYQATRRIPSATNSLLSYHAARGVPSTLAIFRLPPASASPLPVKKNPCAVMMYCAKAQKEDKSGKIRKLLTKLGFAWKKARQNIKVDFNRDGIGATYDDGEKKAKGRIWMAGRRMFGDMKAQMGDLYAELGIGKKKSAFKVARLVRHSKYHDEEHITIMEEDPTGLTYLVCMAGVPINNVTFHIKGRWMRIRGTPPAGKHWGPKERVVDLMLPKPEDDEYKDNDYEVSWYYNQAIIKILKYKGMIKEVPPEKVKNEE